MKKKHSKVDIVEDNKEGDNVELVKITHEDPIEPLDHEETIEEHWEKKAKARDQIPEPEEEKPPLAWSQTEEKPVKKERKPRVSKKAKSDSETIELVEIEKKPHLNLEDLKNLLLPDVKEPKTPKTKRSKKEVKEVLLSV